MLSVPIAPFGRCDCGLRIRFPQVALEIGFRILFVFEPERVDDDAPFSITGFFCWMVHLMSQRMFEVEQESAVVEYACVMESVSKKKLVSIRWKQAFAGPFAINASIRLGLDSDRR